MYSFDKFLLKLKYLMAPCLINDVNQSLRRNLLLALKGQCNAHARDVAGMSIAKLDVGPAT